MFKNVGQVSVNSIVAKRRDRPYRSGRSPDWIKVKKPNRTGRDKVDRGMKLDRRRKLTIKSLVVKQSVVLNGRHSSVSIEGAFWNALKEIAVAQNITANALVSKIDSERQVANLSSAIRVYVVEHYRLCSEGECRSSATGMTCDGEAQAACWAADDARQHAQARRTMTQAVRLAFTRRDQWSLNRPSTTSRIQARLRGGS